MQSVLTGRIRKRNGDHGTPGGRSWKRTSKGLDTWKQLGRIAQDRRQLPNIVGGLCSGRRNGPK